MADQVGPLLMKIGDLLAPKFFVLALYGSLLPQEASSKAIAESSSTSETHGSDILETLDPDLLDTLVEKGKKLQHYQVTSQHAQSHLLEQGIADANKRYPL